MKTHINKRLAINVITILCLFAVTNACVVDWSATSYYYIENLSGQEVTFSSNKKTLTVADGARELVGEECAIGGFAGLSLGYFFGDTLEVRFEDSTVLEFYNNYNNEVGDTCNPYNVYALDIEHCEGERACRAIFTVGEDFISGCE